MGLPALFAYDSNLPANLHNMENFFSYTPVQFLTVSHFFTVGYAVFIAAFVYFILMYPRIAPQYRLATILSCVVSASTAFLLYKLEGSWNDTFTFDFDRGIYVHDQTQLFTNGYRYMNWWVTVPMLLLSMVVLLPFGDAIKKKKRGTQLVLAGLVMVFFSWLGSLFETAGRVEGVSSLGFWVSYLLGWVGYVIVLALVFATISEAKRNVPAAAVALLNKVLLIIFVAWTIYAVTLVQPLLWWSPVSVVTREILFTFADVTSKAIYGVLLSRVALHMTDALPHRGREGSLIDDIRPGTHPEAATTNLNASSEV